MRSDKLGRWLAVVGAALLALPAAGQEERRPDRRRPDREGRIPRDRTRDPRTMMQGRGQGQTPAMAVSDGKLFIVLGRELRRMDADTLEEEKKADIPVPGADDERSREIQEKFIARFDKDGDGAISGDELPRAELLDRLDVNGDGRVTADEAPGPRMMAARMPTGPTTLLVERGSVYVFQGGSLYRFDADSLELMARAELAPKRTGVQGRPGGREGRDRAGDRRTPARRGREAPPEEPRVPDAPVRF